ncbi:MAG: cyclodeaminase/cyclohydrolase family protein [Anaerolineae bacterium]|nr:cyclodeaminase/cyclohydrolase family protein [Anaerolineae bacterium]
MDCSVPSAPSSAQRPLATFLEQLASGEPAPGGGSAAALAGALAAALVSMVCRLTLGRERFAAVQTEMQEALQQAERLRGRLTQAVDDDARAYAAVVAACRLPRGSQAEQEARAAAIQAALQEATLVPLGVARDCAEVLGLARFVARTGNPSAASDGRVAILLAEAALRGAILNVQTNLPGLKDTAFADQVRSEVERLLSRDLADNP